MKKLLLFAAVVLIASCKDDEQPTPASTEQTDQQKIDFFQGKKWFLAYAKSHNDSTGEVIENATAGDPEYLKDDYYEFSSNKTYKFDDNDMLRPNATTNIVDTGTWSFSNSVLTMTSSKMAKTYPMTIFKVTADVMEAELSVPERKMTLRYTFKTIR